MRAFRSLLPVGLAALLIAACVGPGGDGPHPAAVPGSAPAGFSLAALDGRQVALSEFAGVRPVLLIFWATWCPFCDAAVPEVKKLHGGSGATGMAVLAVNVLENPKTVGAYVKARGIGYTVLLDRNGQVATAYGVAGIPTYVVVDRSGKITYRGNILPPDIGKYL